jgi:hypothetical protein
VFVRQTRRSPVIVNGVHGQSSDQPSVIGADFTYEDGGKLLIFSNETTRALGQGDQKLDRQSARRRIL